MIHNNFDSYVRLIRVQSFKIQLKQLPFLYFFVNKCPETAVNCAIVLELAKENYTGQ